MYRNATIVTFMAAGERVHLSHRHRNEVRLRHCTTDIAKNQPRRWTMQTEFNTETERSLSTAVWVVAIMRLSEENRLLTIGMFKHQMQGKLNL